MSLTSQVTIGFAVKCFIQLDFHLCFVVTECTFEGEKALKSMQIAIVCLIKPLKKTIKSNETFSLVNFEISWRK